MGEIIQCCFSKFQERKSETLMQFRSESNFPKLLGLESSLSSPPPSFFWASTVSEYLLHGKAEPEYSDQPFYLWTRYLLNRTQSQKFRGAFNFSHFPFSCCFFFPLISYALRRGGTAVFQKGAELIMGVSHLFN